MLLHLHVKNLAVAAEVAVELGPGLNVLTGETGAGKSILVDSLGLLAGARATGDLIRSGASELTVAGTFDGLPAETGERLREAGVELEDGELVVRRVISSAGRNRVFLNDQPATLRLLTEVLPSLLRIHTQREELGLVSLEVQRLWLDRSAGAAAEEPLERVAASYTEYRRLAERWERLTGDERLRLERLDLLKFQAGEIDAASLTAGEEDELREKRSVLRNIEAIRSALGTALDEVFDRDGAALDRLAIGERELAAVAEWEPRAADWSRELGEARLRLEEVASDLRRRLDAIEGEPESLDAIEDRLASIERLLRKYGSTTAEVLEVRQRIDSELAELEAGEDERGDLERRLKESLERYRQDAEALSRDRREWASALAGRVHAELADLSMAQARFEAQLGYRRRAESPLEIEGHGVEFSSHGFDEVSFVLAANPGEGGGPLAKVASGGELSRVYLALQLAAADAVGDATRSSEGSSALVFDEVDAGIGGAEAAALGTKMARLAGARQVLAVTHLPQVASFADRHFRIRKRVAAGRTEMEILQLGAEDQVEEIARMLGGRKVTDLSREHARELIELASAGTQARSKKKARRTRRKTVSAGGP